MKWRIRTDAGGFWAKTLLCLNAHHSGAFSPMVETRDAYRSFQLEAYCAARDKGGCKTRRFRAQIRPLCTYHKCVCVCVCGGVVVDKNIKRKTTGVRRAVYYTRQRLFSTLVAPGSLSCPSASNKQKLRGFLDQGGLTSGLFVIR